MLKKIFFIVFLMGIVYHFSTITQTFDGKFDSELSFQNISNLFNETQNNKEVEVASIEKEKPFELKTLSEYDCYTDEIYNPEEQICYTQIVPEEIDNIQNQGDELLSDIESDFGDFINTETIWSNIIISMQPDMNIGTELIRYDIDNLTIGKQYRKPFKSEYLKELRDDFINHKNIWKHVNYIIPMEYKKTIKQLEIFTDGKYQYLAFVQPYSDNEAKWVLGIDSLDTDNPRRLTSTVIHELAHLLTLNETQVNLNLNAIYHPKNNETIEKESNHCDQYFTLDGCSKEDSYINSFYHLFWSDLYDEWAVYQEEGDLEAFYTIYSDRYVNMYSATRVEEDIAESFVNFIFMRKDDLWDDWIVDQKISFFYNYPELVKLRTEILSRVYSAYKHNYLLTSNE